ncbi:MAG: SH3 domain-containing protein, partial [Oscillospiraceae bacterium]|nr:SH3 domain-containing protein [Oscillospiraceae bacterium]
MNLKATVIRTAAAAGFALMMTTGVAFASVGTGTVTADSLRMRSEANTTSEILVKAPKGSTVTIEEDAGNGWYKVTYGTETGYMSGEWLTVTLEDGTVIPAAEGVEPEQSRGLVTTSVLNVRAGADTSYEKVGTLKAGTVVDIIADLGNGWYQIDSGYISAEYITLVGADYQGSTQLGASAAAMAKQLLGCRYAYGSAGPNSFDCSGLTYYIYKQLGHTLSRSASTQYYNNGYFVSLDDAQPGDLIFFFNRLDASSGGTLPVPLVGM